METTTIELLNENMIKVKKTITTETEQQFSLEDIDTQIARLQTELNFWNAMKTEGMNKGLKAKTIIPIIPIEEL